MPRKADDDCLQELRWLYDRRDPAEARTDLAAWIAKWQTKYSRLVAWVEENIEETLTFYRLPRQQRKHLKSTNMLERRNEEIERRTHVVRIFPNAASCLRLIRASASKRTRTGSKRIATEHGLPTRAEEGGAAQSRMSHAWGQRSAFSTSATTTILLIGTRSADTIRAGGHALHPTAFVKHNILPPQGPSTHELDARNAESRLDLDDASALRWLERLLGICAAEICV